MQKIKYIIVIVIFLANILLFATKGITQDSLNELVVPPQGAFPAQVAPPQEGFFSKVKTWRPRIPRLKLQLPKKDPLKEQQKLEKKALIEQQKKEHKELIEKQKKERADLKNVQKNIIEAQKKSEKIEEEKINKKNARFKQLKKTERIVTTTTNPQDPLFISKAEILDGKTSLLKIKNIELNYRLEVINQTEKVINYTLLVWERKIALNDTETIKREVRFSKPIIPNDKTIIEYNELNSRRNGEIYAVKIVKIVFEDGTEWVNPA